jgi:hypothetical protein
MDEEQNLISLHHTSISLYLSIACNAFDGA